MRIYFAGPLFTQAEREWNASIVALLEEEHEVFLPQRDVTSGDPNEIFIGDLNGLLNSEVVVAIMDGTDADSGTCWECGHATARGVPVVLVRTDYRTTGDDGWGNLMLTQSAADAIVGVDFKATHKDTAFSILASLDQLDKREY